MKTTLWVFIYAGIVLLAQSSSFAQLSHLKNGEMKEDLKAREEYENMRLRDPATGCIPVNIRNKELNFARNTSSRRNANSFKQGNNAIQSQEVNWKSRGPSDIGGRTYALGIDIKNENTLLAGSTSGGMWRSTDKGNSWNRTSPVNDLPSVKCVVQDTRPGKENTWYYGTGEMGSNTAAYPLWLNVYSGSFGQYYGNGIYKSTNDGQSWSRLESTATHDSASFNQPFNFVHKLAIDRSNTTQDIVYAAVAGGIERSSDGGKTWTMVLGDFNGGPAYSDVAVTSSGIVYAAGESDLSAQGSATDPEWVGIFRSDDGIHWTNITPDGFEPNTYTIVTSIAPSNEKILYVGAYGGGINSFWKYTAGSSDTDGVWEDRSTNLRNSQIEYVGYIKVKPDNENIVYIGATNLWRSTDALKTSTKISNLTYDNGNYDLHVDHETMEFFSNRYSAIVGCDGGVYMTSDIRPSQVSWTSLDNNYLTSQFYTIAIDHSNENDIVIGGMQDNSTYFTNTTNESQPGNSYLVATVPIVQCH